MGPTIGRGVLCVGVGLWCFGVTSLAQAKGYGTQPLQDLASDVAKASQFEQLEHYLGYSPAAADCLTRAFAITAPGQTELDWARTADFRSRCRNVCQDMPYTPALCTDRDFMNSVCGLLEMDRFHQAIPDGGNAGSRCLEVIHRLGTAGIPDGGIETKEVLRADTILPLGDGGVAYKPTDGGRVLVKAPVYSRDDQQFTGLASSYFGYKMSAFTELSKANPSALWVTLHNLQLQAWTQSPDPGYVDSCREYVYEKYWDYSLFEDRAAARGSDYRAVYNLAFTPSAPNGTPRYAIGTLGRMNEPMQQRNGTLLGQEVAFPSETQPKNIFFSTEPFVSVHVTATQTETREQVLAEFAMDPHKFYGGRPVAGDWLFLMDDSLHALVLNGYTNFRHLEDFNYHFDQSNLLAPAYLDEELYEMDSLRQEMAALLYRRAQIRAAVHEYWRRILEEGMNQTYQDNDMLRFKEGGEFINPDPISQFLEGQRLVRDDRFRQLSGITNTFQEFVITGALNTAPSYSVVSGARAGGVLAARSNVARAGANRLSTQPALDQVTFAQHHTSKPTLKGASTGLNYDTSGVSVHQAVSALEQVYLDGLPVLARFEYMQAKVEGSIEALMLHARDLGCLRLYGPNPCDWSPKDFFERIMSPVSLHREVDFQACEESTAQNGFTNVHANIGFSAGGNYVTVEHKGVMVQCTPQDYGASPDQLEVYGKCKEAWVAATIKEFLKALGGGGTVLGHGYFGKQVADSAQLGNGDFGVDMGYDMGWKVQNASPGVVGHYCGLQPSLNGEFHAKGMVFGAEVSLLQGNAQVAMMEGGTATASLEILGETILNDSLDMVPTSFNVMDDQRSLTQEFVRAGATFFVVIVPISISAGLTGTVGVGVALGGGTPENAPGGCTAGNLALTGSFRPFASVDAFATGSVDACLVEAGIKVSLTLIHAELPLTSSLLFKVPTATETDVKMEMESNLDLVLSMLSGRVAAFVEVCYVFDCDSWEVTLFSWNGPGFTKNLFNSHFNDLSIIPVISYLDSH